jgi:superfamily II DNA/RNA helicase
VFLIDEIRAVIESDKFKADFSHVANALLAMRLRQRAHIDVAAQSRLAYLVQSILASAIDWKDGDRELICRVGAEIAEALSHCHQDDRERMTRFRLRAAMLYSFARMPAMGAGVFEPAELKTMLWDLFTSAGAFESLQSTQSERSSTVGSLSAIALGVLDVDLANLANYEHGISESPPIGNAEPLRALAEHLSLGLTASDVAGLREVFRLHRASSVRDNVDADLFGSVANYPFPLVLFPAQQAALKAGLLENARKGWGFASPTGTGKTFLTRLLILDTLNESPDSSIVYLVPTRALVHEVTSSLQRFFAADGVVVSAITPQLIALDNEEAARIEESNVLVLTPEKADLLLRLGSAIMGRAQLVIVDEAHHLESGTRGALLELYLMRLRRMADPPPRVVLLSAVAPNIADLAEWVGGEASGEAYTQRATRMRAGVFRIRRNGRNREGWIDYGDNLSIRLLEGRPEAGVRRLLAQVAQALSRGGPVLIVAKGKGECEQLAETLLEYQSENDLVRTLTDEESERDFIRRLDSRLTREMYVDVAMRRLLRHRIAYHHAGLPPRVRIAVEEAIRARAIDFVFATTTLAEGVNFPFSTVLVQALALREAPEKGRPARYHPVTPRSFWNIAGRAGRPGVDREGQAILFEPTLGLEKINQVIDPYLDASMSRLTPVQSALGETLQTLRADLESGQLSAETLSSAILSPEVPRSVQGAINLVRVALVHAESNAKLSPEEILEGTLAFNQATGEEREFFREIFTGQQAVIDSFFSDPAAPPRTLVAELGLSIDTLTQLRQYASQLEEWKLKSFARTMHGGNADLNQTIFVLGPVAKRMAELEGRVLGGVYGEVANLWLAGIPLSDVRRSISISSISRLEDLISVIYSRVQFLLPWGLYAFDRIVEEEAKQRAIVYNGEIRLLAYLADAGVPTFDALRLVNLDFERVDATRLAAEYHRVGSFKQGVDIVGWIRTQSKENLYRILRGRDNRDLDFDLEVVLAGLSERVEERG